MAHHVNREQIAEPRRALHLFPIPHALADALYLVVDLFIRHLVHGEIDSRGAVVAERHFGLERDGGGNEDRVLVLHVELLDLGRGGGVELALGDGFVGGFVSHAVEDFAQQLLASERLLDDAPGRLAPAEAGNGDAVGDAPVSPVEIRRQIRVLKLDVERGLVVHNFVLSNLHRRLLPARCRDSL